MTGGASGIGPPVALKIPGARGRLVVIADIPGSEEAGTLAAVRIVKAGSKAISAPQGVTNEDAGFRHRRH